MIEHISPSSLPINQIEKDQDIPPPGSRGKLDTKLLYSNRPPPSIGHSQNITLNHQSNDEALKSISTQKSILI